MAFISKNQFSFSDESRRKLLKGFAQRSFLTGTTPGPEFTRAATEGALEVESRRASEIARENARLAQQETQFQRELDFRQRAEQNLNNIRLRQLRDQEKAMNQKRQSDFLNSIFGTALTGLGLALF